MTAQEMLTKLFAMVYNTADRNLAGMTADQSLVQPPSGGNCANWILGHLVNVHNGLMKLLKQPPVWESEQLARAGFDPITGPENAIDWDTLKEKFLGSRDRCLAAIAALSADELKESVPHPFGGTTTREELVGILAFHQTYHVGQLGVARRIAGMDGAIRGPGQPEREVALASPQVH